MKVVVINLGCKLDARIISELCSSFAERVYATDSLKETLEKYLEYYSTAGLCMLPPCKKVVRLLDGEILEDGGFWSGNRKEHYLFLGENEFAVAVVYDKEKKRIYVMGEIASEVTERISELILRN